MKKILVKFIGSFINLMSFFSTRFAANKALSLFSKPRIKKLTESQRDFLNTAYLEELFFDGHSFMAYRWLGKKEPILLLHGWESNASRWQNLIQKLSKKGHSVIAIDAPAHGKSGSKIFNAILYADYINVTVKRFNPSILIGHSVGGMAAVFSIKKYKFDSINKIILLGAPSEFTDVYKRYTNMMGYNDKVINASKEIIKERFGKHPEDFSTSKYLKSFNFKGLIIHDQLDDIIPYSDALSIKESFKNSNLITTNGLGHSLSHVSVEDHISNFIEMN